MTITKKGFKVSMGWNLGNEPISNHLFDPLTSTPIKGTKNKLINVITNNATDNLIKIFWSSRDKNKIKKNIFKSILKGFKNKD